MDRDEKVSTVTLSADLPLRGQRSKKQKCSDVHVQVQICTKSSFFFFFFWQHFKSLYLSHALSQAPLTMPSHVIWIWPRSDPSPGQNLKKCNFSMKCFFFYKQHAMVTCFGHVTHFWSVPIGCQQIRGQRSLKGSYPLKFEKNCQNVYENTMEYIYNKIRILPIETSVRLLQPFLCKAQVSSHNYHNTNPFILKVHFVIIAYYFYNIVQ